MKRVKELEQLARIMVGDNGHVNVYFVSLEGNIQMITTDADAAYGYWRNLPTDVETALEDRKTGVICDTSPIEDGSPVLRTYDESSRWLKLAY